MEKLLNQPICAMTNYLIETIVYLQKYGQVYLVRLPVCEEILQLENLLIPNFSEKMTTIAMQNNIPFLDFTELENNFNYIDGIHLTQNSGKEVSEMIAKWIQHLNSEINE